MKERGKCIHVNRGNILKFIGITEDCDKRKGSIMLDGLHCRNQESCFLDAGKYSPIRFMFLNTLSRQCKKVRKGAVF